MSEVHDNPSISRAAPYSHTEPTRLSQGARDLLTDDLSTLPDRDALFVAGQSRGTTTASRADAHLPVTTARSGSVNRTESQSATIAQKAGSIVKKATVSVAKWIDNHKMLVGVTLGSIGILLLASGFGAPAGAILLGLAIGLPLLAHVIAKHAKKEENPQQNDAATRGVQGHSESLAQVSNAREAPHQITSQSASSSRVDRSSAQDQPFDWRHQTYPNSPRTSHPQAQFVEQDDEEWEEIEEQVPKSRFVDNHDDDEIPGDHGGFSSASAIRPGGLPSSSPPVEPHRQAPAILPRDTDQASSSSTRGIPPNTDSATLRQEGEQLTPKRTSKKGRLDE